MGTKGTNQKNVLPIMLFYSLELNGPCVSHVAVVGLNATFSLHLYLVKENGKIV